MSPAIDFHLAELCHQVVATRGAERLDQLVNEVRQHIGKRWHLCPLTRIRRASIPEPSPRLLGRGGLPRPGAAGLPAATGAAGPSSSASAAAQGSLSKKR